MTVPFKLVTPAKLIFEGDAELVIAVTTEGEEGILPRHAPFLAALKPGVMRANIVQDGASRRLELATGELGWHYHTGGHTLTVDEWKAFLVFLDRYFKH